MTRAAWTPAELRGYRLAWLVEVETIAGTIRAATFALDLDTDAGVIRVPGTVETLDHQETLDLFTLQGEGEPLLVEMVAEGADVATLAASGHRIQGCQVRVSQLRIDRNGDAADDYKDRCEFVAGFAQDVEWGPTSNGGCFLRFGVTAPGLVARAKMPTKHQRISRATWDTAFLSDADLVAYPLVIGNPGRDTLDQDDCFPAARATWLSKQTSYHTMCVGLGVIEADSVRLFQKAGAREGVDVDVGYTWTVAGGTAPSVDRRGQMLAVVDYNIHGYQTGGGSAIGDEYEPPVEEGTDDAVFVSYPDGGGTMWRGRLLQRATDVLAFVFESARVRYDEGALRAAGGVLDGYLIDTVVGESCDPLDWLRENLLPLLPVSIVPGPRGERVIAWRAHPSDADAVAHLDADADPTLEPAERLQESAENGCSAVEIRYGYNARSDRYRYTRRVAAVAEDSTDYGAVEIRSNIAPTWRGFVSIRYATAGMDGHGITVTCTDTGVLGATWTASSRTLAVTFDSLVDTAATIAAQVDGLTDFVAQAGGDTGNAWASTTTASVTTSVTDFGTAAHPALAAAAARSTAGDLVAVDSVDGERSIETPLVYDHATALKVLDWQASAYGPSRRRLSVTGSEETLCGVSLGDIVRCTDSVLGLDGVLGVVEGRQWRSDGVMALRVVLDER